MRVIKQITVIGVCYFSAYHIYSAKPSTVKVSEFVGKMCG